MKKFLSMIFIASAFALGGCSYDDDGLWDSVNRLENRVETLERSVAEMNAEITTLNALVGAIQDGGYVNEVETTQTGYRIKLSNGTVLTINHGADGASAPTVGVAQDSDGLYYWTVTMAGETEWLRADGEKLRVTGDAGESPLLGVDGDGYWTVKYGESGAAARIVGADGNPVKASGEGGSFFLDVDTTDPDCVTITLADGSKLVIPRGDTQLAFVPPADGLPVDFAFGQQRTLELTMRGIVHAETLSFPEGWIAKLDAATATLTLKAPAAAASAAGEGSVSVIAVDKSGRTLMAVQQVYAVDYSHPAGTFVVTEGNMSDQNGTVYYYDRYGKPHKDIYETANPGRTPGNVLQDMWIADGRTVLLCQNGGSRGGDGQVVVCDARTMESRQIYNNLIFDRPAGSGKAGCPQHVAVVGDKAFIQYADAAMESSSGIRVFDLSSGTLKADDVEGTYGAFAVNGAWKGRMWVSRGYVVAALAGAVIFIDPATETIAHRIDFPGRQVKGLAKGYDGNFYAAVSGEFTGSLHSPTYTSDAMIVGIDHTATQIYSHTLTGIKLPVATWQPGINMCASFTRPHLYLLTSSDFSITALDRFDFSSSAFTGNYISLGGYDAIYGYMGVHPYDETLFIGQSVGYTSTAVCRYDVTTNSSSPALIDRQAYAQASPAGVDFAYRFTTGFINK